MNTPKETPEALERIRELLRIERQPDGQDWLVWRVRRPGVAEAGDRAGSVRSLHKGKRKTSYHQRVVKIAGVRYVEARVIFALHFGRWPDGILDHRDRDSLNQRISNFRETNSVGNLRNVSARCSNHSSEFRGVTWDKRYCKWAAQAALCNLYFSGDRRHLALGKFEEIEDAKNVVRVFWYLTDQEHFPYDAFGLPNGVNVYRAAVEGNLTALANGEIDASEYLLPIA